jgi:hypothetical protein
MAYPPSPLINMRQTTMPTTARSVEWLQHPSPAATRPGDTALSTISATSSSHQSPRARTIRAHLWPAFRQCYGVCTLWPVHTLCSYLQGLWAFKRPKSDVNGEHWLVLCSPHDHGRASEATTGTFSRPHRMMACPLPWQGRFRVRIITMLASISGRIWAKTQKKTRTTYT